MSDEYPNVNRITRAMADPPRSEHPEQPPGPMQADQLVAWLLEGAHEIQNAHEALDGFDVPRINPDTGNEMTLAARIAKALG